MIASLAALGILAGAAAALGAVLRRALPLPDGPGEDALAFTAGLGATALVLALLALAGLLPWAPGVLFTLTVPGWLVLVRLARRAVAARPTLASAAAALLVSVAALSALAPVTDPDSLAYPLPIARRLVDTGAWRFWPDLALGVFPLSQELLVASTMTLGADRLGLLSALELVLCAVLLSSLARRTGLDDGARLASLLVGLGCPVVAYLAPSAKEDLLLAAMTLAAAHALVPRDADRGDSTHAPSPLLAARNGGADRFPSRRVALGAAASAGLFAGFAASAKNLGLPVALGVVAAVFAFSRTDRARRTALAAGCALAAGGLFYMANMARFGNPVPPFLSPPLPTFYTPLSQRAVRAALRWGAGRGVVDLVLAPYRMLTEPARFGTAGGLFNPLAWLGLLALAARDLRPRMRPLFVVAAALYVAWLATDHIARLLLPAALLLALPAGAMLARAWRLLPAARVPIGLALTASAASLLLVSGVRVYRFASAPTADAFLARETQNFDEIAWMNDRVHEGRQRVATTFKACFYLRVPWIDLDPVYQAEIPAEKLSDVATLRAHGITHVFIPKGSMPALEPHLTLVRETPASRLGGVHLFRDDPTIATALYAVPRDNRRGESRAR